MTGRGQQFLRQWKLLAILSARRFGSTLEELGEELGYHHRTVRRDLEVLEVAGFLLERERDPVTRQVKVKLPRLAKIPNIPFTLMEILSIYFASNVLKSLKGTPMKEGIDTALQKIEKTLPVHALEYVSSAENSLLAKPGPLKDYRKHVESITKLQQAVAERRKIRVSYRAYGWDKSVHYIYHPYGMTFTNGSIYVVGHSEPRKATRTLLLDRIERIDLREEKFDLPEDFDLEDHLGESFGIYHEEKTYRVKIEFSKDEAQGILEREWHPTQKIRRLKDGRVILSMNVAGLPQVLRWVLSYGSGARVLAPDELVRWAAADLWAAAQTYHSRRKK